MREENGFSSGPAGDSGDALFIVIGGEVVMHLWNWLLPPLFGWRQITFWQALGLLALCRILFGGIGGRGSAAPIPRPHGRALGTHDARGAREIPARHARTLRLRHAGQRKPGVISQFPVLVIPSGAKRGRGTRCFTSGIQ